MAANTGDEGSREQRERLEIEQIRASIEQARASVEEMRVNTALASKRVRWYELVLFAAGGAGLVTLGIAIGEFLRPAGS